MNAYSHFEPVDACIRFLLKGKMLIVGVVDVPTAEFDNLQEPELVEVLYDQNYELAEYMLQLLPGQLSPQDAAAACLCALAGPTAFMHTLLDHCPPIPEFQFRGVGTVTSLLNVAIFYNKHEMLKILLDRGAEPNKRFPEKGIRLPLEDAFCYDTHDCLTVLLHCDRLQPEITQAMLSHWGKLRNDDPNDIFAADVWWSAQLLLEKLTGIPADRDNPYPIPSQLEMQYALEHRNLDLAAHLCKVRPLTEEEQTDAVRYCYARYEHDLKGYLSSSQFDPFSDTSWMNAPAIRFLLRLLERYPHLLNTPELRSALAVTVMYLPQPCKHLQRWVDRLEDGPVRMHYLPTVSDANNLFVSLPTFYSLDVDFFRIWTERLGSRLIPAFSVNAPVHRIHPKDNSLRILFQNAVFIGERFEDALSPMAEYALRNAPEDLLADLMQPGKLLAEESPFALINAALSLPDARRNQILPHIQKTVHYDL